MTQMEFATEFEANLQAALIKEQNHALLNKKIEQRQHDIARIIALPVTGATESLVQYVIDYIRYLPTLLNDLHEAGQQTGMTAITTPVIAAASEFLLAPPAEVEEETGLIALMDEAYLAFRLLEEVNESCLHRIGQPLIPLDMCLSNIMIHTLIDEPFANQLDAMVELRVERLFEKRTEYKESGFEQFMQRLNNADVMNLSQRWSCFSSQLGLQSAFV